MPCKFDPLFNIYDELHSKNSKDTIGELESEVSQFGTERSDDHYDCTLGNVGYICNLLLSWAKLHPKATWRVHKFT